MKLPFASPNLSSSYPAGSPEWWVESMVRLQGVVITNRRLTIGLFVAIGALALGDIAGAREVLRQLIAGG